ncbi:MAG TPA: hypothetical protein VKN35_00980 [Xanthomonadales bacterium]|nr:hypothetical protein [Xanthomonadales bacterium]
MNISPAFSPERGNSAWAVGRVGALSESRWQGRQISHAFARREGRCE